VTIKPEEHLKLAHKVANKFCRSFQISDLDREDAHQEAVLAMIQTSRKFNAEHEGANWPLYVCRKVWWSLTRWRLEKQSMFTGITKERPGPSRKGMDDPEVIRKMVHKEATRATAATQKLLSLLSEEQGRAIYRHHGLEHSLQTIASDEGVSRFTIADRVRRSTKKLRKLFGVAA
jgi:RNA polymerase sigma factor (sigma-70 family)